MARYFKFNGTQVPQSNNFALTKDYQYSGEFTTYDGKQCGDYIGWRYADLTLSWDMLPPETFNFLKSLKGQITFTFTDDAGTEQTEDCIVSSQAFQPTRHERDSLPLTQNITMGVKFIGIH